MLKQMLAAGGVLACAAVDVAVAGGTASAQVPTWGGCCSSSHSAVGQEHRSRNWNGSENENFKRIRLHLHNRNNNVAVARPHGGRNADGDNTGTSVGGL